MEEGWRPESHREEDIDTTPGVWVTPPHPMTDMGGRIIPRGKEEFRQSLGAVSPETRVEWSDDTEEMETDNQRERVGDKEASAVETPDDRDVPEKPWAWNSGSDRGDWDPESDDEEEEGPDQWMKNG